LNIDQVASEHNTVNRVRTAMIVVGACESLFKLINEQLETHQIIVEKIAIVDASVIDSPLKAKQFIK
jgi:IS5 family transposase